MTEIEFHFNVPDKLDYSCRLLRKVHRLGKQAVVTGDQDTLGRLDQLLWSFSASAFLPHCLSTAATHTLAATPIWLATNLQDCPRDRVLINLGDAIPAGFEGFERFVELVSDEAADRLQGRGRWKHYKEQGFELVLHDYAARREAA